MRYDVPAILDYVQRETGHDRVNWVGHSMGGMLMFPYLELEPAGHERIANFVAMGSTIILADAPQRDMLLANRALRTLNLFASPGRLGRPLTYFRMPGMNMIDSFYYSERQRRRSDRLAVLRLHPRGPRPRRLPAARPLPQVRPHALGRRPDRLLRACSAG